MQNMQNSQKPNTNIVRQLELYRLEEKISLQKLASELGVAFSTVSRWFSGKNNPNKIQSYHIEKFLKKRGVYGKK
jgi:transcriptional regulator with XRE-family HTH domain